MSFLFRDLGLSANVTSVAWRAESLPPNKDSLNPKPLIVVAIFFSIIRI